MLVAPVASAIPMSQTTLDTQTMSGTINYQNFSHTVLAEYATTTTCGYCPTASSQLYSIYNSGDYDFYYVSLVADANTKIYGRVKELGVTGVPDVYFDGKYKNVLGAQPDEGNYRTAIELCGERSVPDLDVSVQVDWKGGGTLKISVTVQNNEAEDYDGRLRVYIVEKESRWNDASAHPYHYACLYIPIDKSLAVPRHDVQVLGETYTFSKTWIGGLYGFGDISQDNILVIASVFDSTTDYAVATGAAEPVAQNNQGLLARILEQSFFFRYFLENGIISQIINNL